jgi:hypothetical protein
VKAGLAQARSAAWSAPKSDVIINDVNQAEQRFAAYLTTTTTCGLLSLTIRLNLGLSSA